MGSKNGSAVTIILGIAVLTIIYGYTLFSTIAGLQKNAAARWSNVEAEIRIHNGLIKQLMDIVTASYAEDFEPLQKTKAALRQWETAASQDQQFHVMSDLQTAVGQLITEVQSYQEIIQDQEWTKILADLYTANARISIATHRYTDETRLFNSLIRNAPWSVLADVFSLKPLGEYIIGAISLPDRVSTFTVSDSAAQQ